MTQQQPEFETVQHFDPTQALGKPPGTIRAYLALWMVVSGTVFLYALSGILVIAAIFDWIEFEPAMQVILLVANAVIGAVMLALGFYLGQKVGQQAATEELRLEQLERAAGEDVG